MATRSLVPCVAGTRPALIWAAGFAAAAAIQFGYYTSLSNRSSWFVAATRAEAAARPDPAFRLGGVEWAVSRYATSAALEPFREEFRRACWGLIGLSAATCVSDALARQFPHGIPSTEFFDRDFDPVAHLRRHAAGAPGHCVNRTAIMAAELLSMGIPARLAQLLPPGGRGHNIIEVWDERYGWSVMDPTYGAIAGIGSRPTSAVELLDAPHAGKWWLELSRPPAPSSLVEPGRKSGPDPRLYGGYLLYPEPWLYLREGTRRAPWPFRGAFVSLDMGTSPYGTRHDLLRLGFLLCSLGSLASILVATRGARAVSHRRIPKCLSAPGEWQRP